MKLTNLAVLAGEVWRAGARVRVRIEVVHARAALEARVGQAEDLWNYSISSFSR